MASATLLPLPADWKAHESFESFATFTSPVKRVVEPVGPGFLAHARRTLRGRTWSEDEKIQAEKNVKKVEENKEENELEDEPEDPSIFELDAKDWKNQDHYLVLGITKLRYKATDDQIRIAHRRKVLKHHPDKKAAQGQINEDALFKCIQKAFEVLSDPTKRKQYDSVDKAANVPPPKKNHTGDFISAWGPVFEAEGRFSRNQPVLSLGTMESTKEEVDGFYSFWYNFDSWRTFEYLDEDVPDDSSNRDNKRYIERKNKAARQKHKTDDTARLRKLVDTAISLDPRIQLFKQAEKKKRDQRKWDREAGAREAQKAKEEAEKKKAEEEELAKANREVSKKAKEAAKSAKKKLKRTVRGAPKEVTYFGSEKDAGAIDADVDVILEKFNDLQLKELADSIAGKTDGAVVKSAYETAIAGLVSGGQLKAGSLKYFSS